jgi:hypothetical protein
LYYDEPLNEEEEDRMIDELANYIHVKGLETAAILFLESSKPLSMIGGGMSRLFVSPFLPIFGDEAEIFGGKMINLLEKRKNIEKLIKKIEEIKEEKKSNNLT